MKNNFELLKANRSISQEDSLLIDQIVDKFVQKRREKYIWKNEDKFYSDSKQLLIFVHLNHYPLDFQRFLSFSDKEFNSECVKLFDFVKSFLK